jgi:hypothetical protein
MCGSLLRFAELQGLSPLPGCHFAPADAEIALPASSP